MAFSENKSDGLVYMTASSITVTHAFTTRLGGVSGGVYASLNLKQDLGDDAENVLQNYGLLGKALGFDPEKMAFSRQVHGAEVRLITKADCRPPLLPVPYEADGLITAEKNVPLVIFTADCVPILLHDPVRGAVGAVHAGWRGTVSDIAGAAVRKMARGLGCRPADIRAAIGPCISLCCFETGSDVRDAVVSLLGADAGPYLVPSGEKYRVDLKGVNSLLLERAGLDRRHIDISPDCTSCLCEKYWSHRVTNGRRGSQAAVIMMKGQTQ